MPAPAAGSAWWHTGITPRAFSRGGKPSWAGKVESEAELGLGVPVPKMARGHCDLGATSAPRSD